jgi:hypothetical protein
VKQNLANEAQAYYAHAINALMANEHYASAETLVQIADWDLLYSLGR